MKKFDIEFEALGNNWRATGEFELNPQLNNYMPHVRALHIHEGSGRTYKSVECRGKFFSILFPHLRRQFVAVLNQTCLECLISSDDMMIRNYGEDNEDNTSE